MFYFHPYLQKISNLTSMFQMGWNHQLEKNGPCMEMNFKHTISLWWFQKKYMLFSSLFGEDFLFD